jgi:hypothetical protein
MVRTLFCSGWIRARLCGSALPTTCTSILALAIARIPFLPQGMWGFCRPAHWMLHAALQLSTFRCQNIFLPQIFGFFLLHVAFYYLLLNMGCVRWVCKVSISTSQGMMSALYRVISQSGLHSNTGNVTCKDTDQCHAGVT